MQALAATAWRLAADHNAGITHAGFVSYEAVLAANAELQQSLAQGPYGTGQAGTERAHIVETMA